MKKERVILNSLIGELINEEMELLKMDSIIQSTLGTNSVYEGDVKDVIENGNWSYGIQGSNDWINVDFEVVVDDGDLNPTIEITSIDLI